MIIALPHDTMEDGEVSAATLGDEGFSDDIVHAVEILPEQGDEHWAARGARATPACLNTLSRSPEGVRPAGAGLAAAAAQSWCDMPSS